MFSECSKLNVNGFNKNDLKDRWKVEQLNFLKHKAGVLGGDEWRELIANFH